MNKRYIDIGIQTALTILGLGAVLLSYYPDPAIKYWSPIVGLLGQPVWLYVSWKAKMWGMTINCFGYIGVFLYGLYLAHPKLLEFV
jgi:hypothetical protein